jgi:hypothetical protein
MPGDDHRRGSPDACRHDPPIAIDTGPRARLTPHRNGVKGAADTEFSTMRGLPTVLNAHGFHRDCVAAADARLRLTHTTAKTTTKTV